MAIDLVVVLALFALAWLGAHRGAAESGVRLVGLAVAYAAGWGAGKLAGAPLADALGVAPWLGLVAAGALGFLGAQGLVEIAARKVRAAADDDASDASRALGSLLGIARGALLLLPILWLAGFAESVRQLNPAGGLPDLSGARSAAVGQAVAGAAAERIGANGDGGTRVVTHWIARPGESIAALSEIAADPRVRVLQSDAGFWRDLESGDVAGALARPTFAELARDAQLRGRFAALGLVPATAAVDAQQFHDALAVVMAEVGPRLRRVKEDPAFQDLLADEALRARVQAGDTLAALMDPRVQHLVATASR
jgi:hypothetical protein